MAVPQQETNQNRIFRYSKTMFRHVWFVFVIVCGIWFVLANSNKLIYFILFSPVVYIYARSLFEYVDFYANRIVINSPLSIFKSGRKKELFYNEIREVRFIFYEGYNYRYHRLEVTKNKDRTYRYDFPSFKLEIVPVLLRHIKRANVPIRLGKGTNFLNKVKDLLDESTILV